MGGTEKDPELEALDDRLNQARKKAQRYEGRSAPSPMGRAFSMGIHMVVGVVVGLIVGVNLDVWLGTEPLLLIVFVLLGFGAGMRNVIRDALRMQAEMDASADEEEKADKADKD